MHQGMGDLLRELVHFAVEHSIMMCYEGNLLGNWKFLFVIFPRSF